MSSSSRLPRACAAALLGLLAAGAAQAGSSVTYVQPEQFTDFARNQIERERMEQDLSAHFATLAKALPAGQNLTISISDIDLAGRMEWTRLQNTEIRLLTGGADWPRITLHYALEAGGSVISQGDAQLSDMNYLNQLNRLSSSETLRYEKTMINAWFAKTFGVRTPG